MRDRPERVQVAETFCRPKKISPGPSPFLDASSEASGTIEKRAKTEQYRADKTRRGDVSVSGGVGLLGV